MDRTRTLYKIFESGDVGPLGEILEDHANFSIPGRSQLSGVYLGAGAIAGLIQKRFELSNGTLRLFGEDIATTQHHGIVVYAASAMRNGEEHTSHEILIAGHNGNRIARLYLYIFDQYRFDNFWG